MRFILALALTDGSISKYLPVLHQKNYEVDVLESGDPVTTLTRNETPDAILYFSNFSPESTDKLSLLKNTYPGVPLIYIHDQETRLKKRESLEQWAEVVIEKPIPSFIPDIIENQIHKLSSSSTNPQTLIPKAFGFDEPAKASEKMQRLMRIAGKVAPTDATILLTGESGTGKEVTATWIHNHSLRKQRPFVAINCGAITETILESELFGHKKGSFTGAEKDKIGLFEAAHNGTLFLDEIGEMPYNLQVKLLRVIQERKIRRVGDVESISVNVRIIAATNKDLRQLVQDKLFREDLFYRLNVIHLHLPALRERKETLNALLPTFLYFYAQKHQKKVQAIAPSTENILMNYDYPGNIRELQNILEFAVIMCESGVLQIQDLPLELQRDAPHNLLPAPFTKPGFETLHDLLNKVYNLSNPTILDVEKILIQEKLKIFQENQKQVADSLGISRTSLWRKMKEYQIEGK